MAPFVGLARLRVHPQVVLAGELQIIDLAGVDIHIEDLAVIRYQKQRVDAVHAHETTFLLLNRLEADSVRI